MTASLELRGVSRRFGAVRAIDAVDLTVAAGDRHALIGPNGAGKSTLVSLVSGQLRPSAGDVFFEGDPITRTRLYRRVARGIVQTFQRSSLFAPMAAVDNVLFAVTRVEGRGGRVVPLRRGRFEVEAMTLLDRVGLEARAWTPAGQLSHGERRQLELAVALACRPRLLLLDEPTAGMSPAETAQFVELLRALPAQLTIVIVEHDFDVVAQLASLVTVLSEGRVLMTGTPEEVRSAPAVQMAYFGTEDEEPVFGPA